MIAETMTGTAPVSLNRQKKRGFTLTEIAIVLGIIGLILGAIWVAAAAVYNNLRVAHANTQVLQLAQGIRGLYASSNSTTGLTVDQLVCAKAAPSDMIITACGGPATLSNPFPTGTTTVLPTTDGFGFVITLSAVPRSACDSLIVAVAGPSRDPGLFVAQTAYAVGATGTAITTAATPATADAAAGATVANVGGCIAAGTATTTVSFGFSLK